MTTRNPPLLYGCPLLRRDAERQSLHFVISGSVGCLLLRKKIDCFERDESPTTRRYAATGTVRQKRIAAN